MRLKSLFFPIIMVVSLFIFIGFIWPEIQKLIQVNNEKVAKNAELKAVKEKQAAIELIGKKITDNSEQKNIVDSYLPVNKAEERIVNGINYLAGDANVSLINVGLDNVKKTELLADNSTSVSPIFGAIAKTPVTDPSVPVMDPLTGLPMDTTIKLQGLRVNASIAGEYKDIRIFLSGIQKMPILNNIKSVNIAKPKKDLNNPTASETALTADVVIDFGYMAFAVINQQQIDSVKEGVDTSVLDTLKTYMSSKSEMNTSESSIVRGKTNPFLAN